MTTDMKEVIEWARASGNCTKGEFELLLALAEIGRLAVEAQVANMDPDITRNEWVLRRDATDAAADAFLARQNEGSGT